MGMAALAALSALAAAGVGGAGIASGNDSKRKEGRANAQKMGLMNQAAQSYEDYRPMAAQQNMNSLGQRTGLLQPINGALGKMYGAGTQLDLSAASKNPFVGVPGATGQPGSVGPTGRPSDSDPAVQHYTDMGFTPQEGHFLSQNKGVIAEPGVVKMPTESYRKFFNLSDLMKKNGY